MSTTNAYRVDIVPALTHIAGDRITAEDYSVPCGMDSIVYLGKTPCKQQTWSIPAGKVAIYSTWSKYKRDYVVMSVRTADAKNATRRA